MTVADDPSVPGLTADHSSLSCQPGHSTAPGPEPRVLIVGEAAGLHSLPTVQVQPALTITTTQTSWSWALMTVDTNSLTLTSCSQIKVNHFRPSLTIQLSIVSMKDHQQNVSLSVRTLPWRSSPGPPSLSCSSWWSRSTSYRPPGPGRGSHSGNQWISVRLELHNSLPRLSEQARVIRTGLSSSSPHWSPSP